MSGVVIREAVVEDAPEMARVNEAGWREGYEDICPPEVFEKLPVARWKRDMSHGLRSPRGASFTRIAERGGVVCGYTFVAAPGREEPDDSGLAELVAMYVLRDSWRRGVGSALMEAALERVTGHGFAEIFLWTFKENDRAISFYERHGFARDGQERPFVPYGIRTIRMTRALG